MFFNAILKGCGRKEQTMDEMKVFSEEMLENVRKAGFSGAMTSCVSLWR